MDSYDATSDAAILGQIRELATGISDERTRAVLQNVSGALELNPQPIPPGILRIEVCPAPRIVARMGEFSPWRKGLTWVSIGSSHRSIGMRR